MTVKNFFQLAQMQTTITTVLTSFFGAVYAWYNYGIFNPFLTLLALLLVLFFLMAVNIRDNYVDYEVASKKGARSADRMVIGRESLKLKEVRAAYTILGVLSALIILFLTVQTTIFLFFAAVISFAIGVLYTAGPLPISSTPTGEIFTGITMGFGVFFATFYVNTFQVLTFSGSAIIEVLMVSTPTTICAINIVLANNICDLEEDVEDNRYTLPYYIDISKASLLFALLYYVAYLSVVLSVVLDILPLTTILSLLSFPFIQKNINSFMNDSDKNKNRGLRLLLLIQSLYQ